VESLDRKDTSSDDSFATGLEFCVSGEEKRPTTRFTMASLLY